MTKRPPQRGVKANRSTKETSTQAARHPEDSWVEMTEMVLPQHTNSHGTVFGGVVMSWVDIAAATCSLRHCRKPVVTASIDALHFLAPIKQGHIVSIKASINFVGRSSCEVGVKVVSENPITGVRSHTASAYLTFVALDDNGRPTEMPPLEPVTKDEKRRYEAAQIRRKSRLDLKETLFTKDRLKERQRGG